MRSEAARGPGTRGGCWLAGSLLGRWTLGADALPGIVTAGGGRARTSPPEAATHAEPG